MKSPLYFLVLTLSILTATAAPLGTAFTYQGRLAQGTTPANGIYDFTFALADEAGLNYGAPRNVPGVGVTNGYFTVSLDWGNVFDGAALDPTITVKTNGAAIYTTLTPRQPLTATPYALMSAGLTPSAASAALQFTNAANTFAGNGSALTSLNPANLAPRPHSRCQHRPQHPPHQPGGSPAATAAPPALITSAPPTTNPSNSKSTTLAPFALNPVTSTSLTSLAALRIIPWRLGCEARSSPAAAATLWPPMSAALQVAMDIRSVAPDSAIGGGFVNTIHTSADYSTLAGGYGNIIHTNAAYSSIGGGWAGSIYAFASTIAGGDANIIRNNAYHGAIGGGYANRIEPDSYASTIAGGQFNSIQTGAFGCTMAGGQWNTIESNANRSVIGGDNITSSAPIPPLHSLPVD